MICSWRWFIHPATAITTNRNGSRTLGISLDHYPEPPCAGTNLRRFKQIQFPDHTGNRHPARPYLRSIARNEHTQIANAFRPEYPIKLPASSGSQFCPSRAFPSFRYCQRYRAAVLRPDNRPAPTKCKSAYCFFGAGSGPPPCGSVKRNEPKIMWACAVDGVSDATYQGARVR